MAYLYQPLEKFEAKRAHCLPPEVRRERADQLALQGDVAALFYLDTGPRIAGVHGWPAEWVPGFTIPRARTGLPGRLPENAGDRTSDVVELIREDWLDALVKRNRTRAEYHLSRMLSWSEVLLRGAALEYLTKAGDHKLNAKDTAEDRASLVGVVVARGLAERVEPLTEEEAAKYRRQGDTEEEIEARHIRRERAPALVVEHEYRTAFVTALTTWKPGLQGGRTLHSWAWLLVERRLRDWIDDVQPWLVFHDRRSPEFADLNAELAEAEDEEERRKIIEAHGYVPTNRRGRLYLGEWQGKRVRLVGGAGDVEDRYGRRDDLKHPKDYAGALPSHATRRRSMGSTWARRETLRSEDAEAVFKFLELAGVYFPQEEDPELRWATHPGYRWQLVGHWNGGEAEGAYSALLTVRAVVLAASAKGRTDAIRDGAPLAQDAEQQLGRGAFVDAYMLLRDCAPPPPLPVKRGRGRPPKQPEPRCSTLLKEADKAVDLTGKALVRAGVLNPDDAWDMADAWEHLYRDLRENVRANSEYMMGRLPEHETPEKPGPVGVRRDWTRRAAGGGDSEK